MKYVCVGGPLHEEDLEIPDHMRGWNVTRVTPSSRFSALHEPLADVSASIPYERHVYRVTPFQGGRDMPRRYYACYQGVR